MRFGCLNCCFYASSNLKKMPSTASQVTISFEHMILKLIKVIVKYCFHCFHCWELNKKISLVRMVSPVNTVSFTLNDEKVLLASVSPRLTLLDWLRAQPGLTGTKKMCGEGGCGCCVVSVTRKDPATEKDSTIAINSVSMYDNEAF